MPVSEEKLVVIVPAFNEERSLGDVLRDLKKFANFIIVVDDGSSDRTGEIARKEDVVFLRHLINRGLGASLQTGFRKALMSNAEYIVTFDADGQHRASDIPRLLRPLQNNVADVVIGSRNFSGRAPFLRRAYNYTANLIGFILFGIYVADTQSGLRAFRREALSKIRVLGDRMEVSSEIIGEIKRLGLRLKEIPIEPIYTDYSLSKGQSFFNGIKTFFSLLLHRFRRF